MTSPARPPRRPPARGGFAHTPAVYWRRRIVLLAVLCLVGWALVALLPGGGDGGDAKPASAGTTAMTSAPSSTPAHSAKSHKKQQQKKKNKDRVVRVDLPAAQGKCDPATVSVTPSVASGEYAGGAVPVRLAFATSGSTACTLDIGPKDLLLQVSAADDTETPVWESSACAEVPEESLTLQPTWSTTLELTWSGRKSHKHCDQPGEFVAPGDYGVDAALLGGEPGTEEFALTERPAPKPTKRAKPAKSDQPPTKPPDENR